MLSFGLFLSKDNRAALNLYFTTPGAFTDESTASMGLRCFQVGEGSF